MRLRTLLPFASVLLSTVASAQVNTFQFDGTVARANTTSVLGQNLPPSEVQQGIPVASPFSITFSYDLAQTPYDQYATTTEYDAPFALSGTIGDRGFTGTASLVFLGDSLPGEGEDQFYLFINELVYGTSTDPTAQILTETNPFVGSDYVLNSIRVLLTDSSGTAFSGPTLPNALDLAAFDSNSFVVSYLDRNVVSDDSDDTRTEFFGGVDRVTKIDAVPEPATFVALGLGVALLRRRKR